MQVSKWGNSLALRLPAAVVEVMGLKEGDDVEVVVASAKRVELQRKPANRELIERLREHRGTLPADFRFDRLDAYDEHRR